MSLEVLTQFERSENYVPKTTKSSLCKSQLVRLSSKLEKGKNSQSATVLSCLTNI